jgi:hypothetical protein
MDHPEPVESPQESSPADAQPVSELVSELASEVATLVKQELALATAEMERKAHDAVTNLGRIVVGGALGVASLFALVATVVLALGRAIPLWAAAGAIAAVLGGSAYALVRSGWSALRAMTIMPTETLASLRDDRRWATEQIEATRDQMSATMGEVRRRLATTTTKRKRTPSKRKHPPA